MRAAIYTRVSSPGQATADAASLPDQERAALALCQERGWEVVEHYQDAGRSATNDDLENRPAMQRLLLDAAAGRFEAVACYHVDRLNRNMEAGGTIASVLKNSRVVVVTPQGTINFGNRTDKLLYYVNSYSAEDEAERIRTRCDDKKRFYAEQGHLVDYQEPLGYHWQAGDLRRGKPNRLLPDEEELATVRTVFHLAAEQGFTVRQITAWLNEHHRKARRGGQWCASMVLHLLRDERYCGRWPAWRNNVNKKARDKHPDRAPEVYYARPEFCPPPAVSPEEWERAQVTLSHHKRRTRRPMKHAFLLNGYLYCAHCGAPMVGRMIGRSGEDVGRYYSCSEKKANQEQPCRGRTVTAQPLEEAAWALVEELAEHPEAAEAYARAARDKALPTDREELARLAKKIATADGLLDGFIRMRAAGEITAAELAKHRQDLEADRAAWEERAADLRQQIEDEEAVLHAAQEAAGMAGEAVAALDLQGRRWWLGRLAFHMTLGCEDWAAPARQRRYQVDIAWAGEVLLGAAVVTNPNALARNTAICARVTSHSGW